MTDEELVAIVAALILSGAIGGALLVAHLLYLRAKRQAPAAAQRWLDEWRDQR